MYLIFYNNISGKHRSNHYHQRQYQSSYSGPHPRTHRLVCFLFFAIICPEWTKMKMCNQIRTNIEPWCHCHAVIYTFKKCSLLFKLYSRWYQRERISSISINNYPCIRRDVWGYCNWLCMHVCKFLWIFVSPQANLINPSSHILECFTQDGMNACPGSPRWWRGNKSKSKFYYDSIYDYDIYPVFIFWALVLKLFVAQIPVYEIGHIL